MIKPFIKFIAFLKEFNKLGERGVLNIYKDSNNFIWVDDIQEIIDEKTCTSTIPQIFSGKIDFQHSLFSLKKPIKPIIEIPNEYSEYIFFDEAKNIFTTKNESNEEKTHLELFRESERGQKLISIVELYKNKRKTYKRLFRAYNDIKNDSNLEIVLSVGFVQFRRRINNDNVKIINQHLFHFPLTVDVDFRNCVKLSFSNETPYADSFFFNNLPIEKEALSNVIDRFEQEVNDNGFEYISKEGFRNLIKDSLQKISGNSFFENLLLKPPIEKCDLDKFKISYSPAISIKQKKPRFFQKLTEDIITYNKDNEAETPLFNLLIKSPNARGNNNEKENYFQNAFYNEHERKLKNLKQKDDFSDFFPLPSNEEQKSIYKEYLNRNLTVVTGPPGTGKSHTIVNILCSLLAEGKRVLVTAQTDKALESLLDKIPKVFDSLVFTEIQLETDKNRFSLENSIDNLSNLLKNDFHLNISDNIQEIDNLKGEYIDLKTKAIKALEREYTEYESNDVFNDLRPYQIIKKNNKKDKNEWNWIKDDIEEDKVDDTVKTITEYKKLNSTIKGYEDRLYYPPSKNSSLKKEMEDLKEEFSKFSLNDYLEAETEYQKLLANSSLTESTFERMKSIDFSAISDFCDRYREANLVIKQISEIDELLKKLDNYNGEKDLKSNKSFNEVLEAEADIETYISIIGKGKDKVSLPTRYTNSQFKQVKYLETFTINGNKCSNRESLEQLKELAVALREIDRQYKIIEKKGFAVNKDGSSDLKVHINALKEAKESVQKNKELLDKINNDANLVNFIDCSGVEKTQIDTFRDKARFYKERIKVLSEKQEELKKQENVLVEANKKISQLGLTDRFKKYLPLNDISDAKLFEELKEEVEKTLIQIENEIEYSSQQEKLKGVLPNTFQKLLEIQEEYINKENFEYARVNKFLEENNIIDLQDCKTKMFDINKKIFEKKCSILYDLAKENFKKQFKDDEVGEFINILNQYKLNLSQASRGTKDAVKYQRLIRKNSQQISPKLSCWVMKFNDVLNAVGKKSNIFDCIIVDEASQLNFVSLLLGYYTKNMIVVGDSKQTAPSSLTRESADDFNSIRDKYLDYMGEEKIHIRSDNSLFDLAGTVAGGSNVDLEEHFRCVPEIIEFSKHHFYGGKLRPLKQLNSNRLVPKQMVLVESAYQEEGVVKRETETVKEYITTLLKNERYANKTIGIVSLGTSEHTKKLKEILEEINREDIEKHKLIIEDATKFQGDERDVMLVSLGVARDSEKHTKPSAIRSNEAEKRKINVALSRAKEQMILFHSVKAEDLQPYDFRNEIIKFFAEEYKEVEDLIIDEFDEERTRYNVPEPFDSWFEIDVAKCLIKKGFSKITPQYKVKEDENPEGKKIRVNFKLDLVVYNNGKRVAIECDGDPFHSLPEDVAYDVERQEFLERVGWKVGRILYSAFKREPEKEIEKLVAFIKRNTKKDEVVKPTVVITNPIDEPEEKNENTKAYIDSSTFTNSKRDKNDDRVKPNKIIAYFNLSEDGTYQIQDEYDKECKDHLVIKEKHRNGFLLQCYDNGCVNKVSVTLLLGKKRNKQYSNGKSNAANLSSLRLIKKDEILGIKTIRNGVVYFKAHKTEDIKLHQNLHVKGNKVIYDEFSSIDYKILSLRKLGRIERIVLKSFTAQSKNMNNNYYETEWEIIKPIVGLSKPKKNLDSTQKQLFVGNKKVVECNNIVLIKYLDNNETLKVQIIEGSSIGNNMSNDVSKIKITSPLGKALKGKGVGDIVKIENINKKVEIIEIIKSN